MYDLTAFTGVIRRFLELFDRLIPLEQEKLSAVSQKKVAALDDIMKREQAEILALRGLEQKRARVQEEAGWKDLKFREILERVPEEERPELQKLFDELGSRVKTFQSLTESSKNIMEVNLHAINQLIAQQTHGRPQTYGEDGSLQLGEAHFTDRRI